MIQNIVIYSLHYPHLKKQSNVLSIIAQDEEIDEVEIENDLKKSHKVEFCGAIFSIWSKKIDA